MSASSARKAYCWFRLLEIMMKLKLISNATMLGAARFTDPTKRSIP